jgi:hypothetical protein
MPQAHGRAPKRAEVARVASSYETPPLRKVAGKNPVVPILAGLVVLAAAGIAILVLASRPGKSVSQVEVPSLATAGGSERAESESAAVADPVQPVPATEVATAQFEFHHTRPGYKESFYFLGEVENTSSFAISKPEVVVVLLDAEGKEQGTDHGYAVDDVLEPGQKSYVSAIVTDPPAHSSMRFEVVARPLTYRPKLAQKLRVDARRPRQNDAGIYEFWGSVHNDGSEPASFVNVRVLAFDAANKLLGIDSSYAKADVIQPGASARFEVSAVGFAETPTRFQFQVSGTVR